ncbi:MAG TPA: hypothetical protein VJ851_00790 [Jatrophihabitans sp.]|nr:hypothetical protein [Jatrophihabitans sp.]
MAYHEAFWVTAGTVAPVIGLAHAVALGRNVGAISSYVDRHRAALAEMRTTMSALELETESARSRLKGTEDDLDAVEDILQAQDRKLVALRKAIQAEQLIDRKLPRLLRRASAIDLIIELSWSLSGAALLLALISLSSGQDLIPELGEVVMIGLTSMSIPTSSGLGRFNFRKEIGER